MSSPIVIPTSPAALTACKASTIAPILGLFEFDIFGKVGFIYCLSVGFVLFLIARRIVHSPFGLSLRAIRNNPLRAAAIGIPVNRRLIAIYTVAAFYAGIAGALFTQSTALASLDVFAFDRSADLLLVLVIGGTGYLYGGLIGAVIFKFLQEYLVDADAAILAVLDRSVSGGDRADRPRADASVGAGGAAPVVPCVRREGALRPPKEARHDVRAGDHRAAKTLRRACGDADLSLKVKTRRAMP